MQMKRHDFLAIAATAVLALTPMASWAMSADTAAPSMEAAATPVIPLPAKVELGTGTFVLDADTRLVASGGEAARIARDLAARIQRSRGFAPALAQAAGKHAAIVLSLDPK